MSNKKNGRKKTNMSTIDKLLGRGIQIFNYLLFSPLSGEDFQFDYFSDGLKPPTSIYIPLIEKILHQLIW